MQQSAQTLKVQLVSFYMCVSRVSTTEDIEHVYPARGSSVAPSEPVTLTQEDTLA